MPKYTFDKKRIMESRVFYPYLFEFAKILGKIDWTEYLYEGDVHLACESRDKNITYDNEYVIHRLNSVPKKLSYYVFGGAVYELLNNNYKKVVNLHKFTDKTGDLDILLSFPFFDNSVIQEKLEESNPKILGEFKNMHRDGVYFYIPFFVRDGGMNPCYFHCAKWVLDKMANVIREDNISVKEAVDFDITDYITSYQKLHYSEVLNKMHLIIISESTMLKIQIVVKISQDGIESIDHVLEFVMAFSDDVSSDKSNHCFTMSPQGEIYFESRTAPPPLLPPIDIPFNDSIVHIQHTNKLFGENTAAYKDRSIFLRNAQRHRIDVNGYGSLHKAFNHVGRFLYLITLFKEASYKKMNDPFLKEVKKAFQHMCNTFWRDLSSFIGSKDYTEHTEYLESWTDLTYYKIENRKFEFIQLPYINIFIAYLDVASSDNIRNVLNVISPVLQDSTKLISVGIDVKKIAEVLGKMAEKAKGSKIKTIEKNNFFYAELMKLVRSNYKESQNPVLFKKGSIPAPDAEVHVHYRSPTPAALRSMSASASMSRTPGSTNLAKKSPSKRKTTRSAPHNNKRQNSKRQTSKRRSSKRVRSV